MARPKRASKRKGRMTTLPFGAAGVSLAMVGGASAAAAPTIDVPLHDTASRPMIILGEEEIVDVNLGTFYVLDQENADFSPGVQLARRGCGGCGGCRGCAARGCGGCGGGGCAVRAIRGCGGCGGCRGCAVRVRACGGCGGCGCGCAPCWVWTAFGRIWVC
jgi:hypothetical protein